MSDILERISEYLQLGGLFNPELANHQAVSKLIIDCRNKIKEQSKIIEYNNRTIDELRYINAFEHVLKEDKMAVKSVRSVRCKNTEPYTTRAPVGEFTWYVYNINSGHIVAATYSEGMAKTILNGIGAEPIKYKDLYGICELYRPLEPMV